MREFAFGTDDQFENLKQMLEDNKCHVFCECILPDCCDIEKARVGFEKNRNGNYIVYIDKGIHAETESNSFKNFLGAGKIVFLLFDDMVEFLHSLQPLFEKSNSTKKSNLKEKESDEEIELLQMVWPEEIANPLKKKIFGQDDVIEEIADKIVINHIRKEPELLTMVLIGPTATGKSETAKSLSRVLSEVYETPYGFIEIAGSEFVGEHTVHRFFGAPPGYIGHGNETVLEPVRKNPRHVIVINEIEKADIKLLTGLMEAIDTGYLGMADNSKPINLNQCIMFFTSNIPIDMDDYKSLSKFDKAEMCRDAFTKHCGRPEISGKIGDFVVFSPLSDIAIKNIVMKFIKEELYNYEVTLKYVDEKLMMDFLKHQTKYGARGIRELVRSSIGEILLREKKLNVLRNKLVILRGSIEEIEFEIA